MAGLPKKYAKMGFKKGWAAYRAKKRGRSRKSTSRRVKTTPRKRRYFGRKRKRTRTKKKFGLLRFGVAILAKRVANVIGAGTPYNPTVYMRSGDWGQAARAYALNEGASWTGYDFGQKRWDTTQAAANYGLLIGGMYGGKFLNKRVPFPKNNHINW